MTYIPSETGMVGVADSARILRAVFPNYPDLQPCNSIPGLEPTCPISADSVRGRRSTYNPPRFTSSRAIVR
jgi:hypothetical protein